MFIEYLWISTTQNGKLVIIDSEFEETVFPTMNDGTLGG
jgi:hypothetical protein